MSRSESDFLSLSGKTVVITGALGFLGKFFCNGFANNGANVVIIDIDEMECQKFAKDVGHKYGVKSRGFGCDITSKKSVNKVFNDIFIDFPNVDVLINNASYKSISPKLLHEKFENYSLEEWKRMIDVNLNGLFLCTQKVGSFMIKNRIKGSIINISSIYGFLGTDHRIYPNETGRANNPAAYSATKGSILSLTKYLSTYWGDVGIRVNSISPGGVKNNQDSGFIKNYSSLVPMKRMAEPKEMVGIAIFLASQDSSYITGQNITVDGGLSAW
jgi:NAD(P)-dependent dehydrogenase (short-subunit alcohol dehydrogenase family)